MKTNVAAQSPRPRMLRFAHNGHAYFYDPAVDGFAVFWNGQRFAAKTGLMCKSLIDRFASRRQFLRSRKAS